MRVLGMMSGTSADGIDVALVRIHGAPPRISARFQAHHHVRFPAPLRAAILRVANGASTTAAEISQLDFRLGEEFAAAAIAACKRWRVPLRKIDLIGSHGQTIFHQGVPAPFLGGRKIASTLQIGEPSVIAARTGIATIGDFRPADIAAGGQGAPLVPFVDYLMYRDKRRGRVALNIGGIANVTVIPAGARPQDVYAFDTGPGNMVIDALVEWATRGRMNFDRDARIARRGEVLRNLIEQLLREPYLSKQPPKTAGREEFGRSFAERIIAWGKKHRAKPEALVATATALTYLSIADAFEQFIFPGAHVEQVILAGGGANNPLIHKALTLLLPEIEFMFADEFGVPTQAKEAFAFAVLAYEAYHARASNLPSATGAKHAAVLGKLVRGRAK
ncbi:MAG TPA: anhydro-N-acetylmuramic acid kinase [Candidatus Sulfotelmatobacter sp.]|nr:anhydro-N-acetylmuramic acid kinase [Candidatus Sulfotelmatobacter sp.]